MHVEYTIEKEQSKVTRGERIRQLAKYTVMRIRTNSPKHSWPHIVVVIVVFVGGGGLRRSRDFDMGTRFAGSKWGFGWGMVCCMLHGGQDISLFSCCGWRWWWAGQLLGCFYFVVIVIFNRDVLWVDVRVVC